MNVTFSLERFCQYVLALETEHALRLFAEQGRTWPEPKLNFQHPQDPQVELSIVMPVWNPDAAQLERALRSLKDQDFGDLRYEIVLSDDASKDDTARAVLERVGLPCARYHRHEKNIGGMPNFNWSVSAARGAWIHMLHQDDWVEPGFYQALLRGPAAASGTDLRFCRTRLRDETVGQTRLMFDEAPAAGVLAAFLDRQVVCQRIQFAGTLFSRRAVEAVGAFDLEIGPAADWDFWARIGSRFSVWYCPEQLATYTLHAASWTNRGAAGFADARAFEKYRITLQRMLSYVAPEKRRATAAGFLQNMFGRVIDIALRNRQQGKAIASIPLGHALFTGCKQAGFLPDVEKILFGVGQPASVPAPARA